MKKPTPSVCHGSILLVTLTLITLLFVLVWRAFDYSLFTGRAACRIQLRQQVFTLGDSAIEMLFAQFKDGFRQYGGSFGNMTPDRTFFKTYLTGTTPLRVPTGAAFPELAAYFPDVSDFPSARLDQSPTQVFTTYAIEPLDAQGRVAASGTCDAVITNSPEGLREGRAYRYLATVDVALPTRNGTVTAHLSRIFEFQVKSFLNYAIFANSYLEIHPGPNMTITGPVHTNSGLFVGAGGGTVTFTDSVEGVQLPGTSGSSYNGIYTGRMKSPSNNSTATDLQHGDTAATPAGVGWTNRNANSKPVTPLDIDPSKFSTVDSNPNNDSYHEIVEAAVFPLTNNPDPFSPNDNRTNASTPFDYQHLQTLRMANVADLIITLDNASHDVTQPATVTITDSSGNGISPTSDLYKAFVVGNFTTARGSQITNKVLTTTDSFVDVREQDSHGNAMMQVTTVDIAALNAAAAAGAFTIPSDTGLGIVINDLRPTKAYTPAVTHNVYTTSTNKYGQVVVTGTTVVVDSPAVPKTEPAVRLKNGYVMPSGGLTIVSQNPVYVQGDYNTGGSASNQPVSNTRTGNWSDPTRPDPTTVTSASGLITYTDPVTNRTNTYYWQPAAIVADAVNVLSNNWSDARAGTMPTATPTTINAAFLAGNVPTTDTNYSGGVENFPRFLENWSGVRFNYVGSMVILFPSQQAVGTWGKSGVYNAPTRNWAYDKNFMQFGVPLLSSGGSSMGGMSGGGSRKTIAGGGAKMFFRKQWISRNVQ